MGKLVDLLGGSVGSLIGSVGGVIDNLTTSGEEKLEAQRKLLEIENSFRRALLEADVQIAQEQAEVIKAEAASQSAAARNWRPHLMYVCVFIVAYNYALAPMFGLTSISPLPDQLWQLIIMGVGGYMGLRSAEKLIPQWAPKPR